MCTRAVAAIAIALITATGCVQIDELRSPVASLAPGQRPAVKTDEAGLWMISDKMEERVRTSGRVVHDPALKDYMRGIVCRLAPEHCADIRFHIVRTPHFNASMAPNGYMEVWTGLILRAENEAQLAYVLGHEIGHFLLRHSIQRWRDVRTKANVATLVDIVGAAAGIGYAGDIAGLVAVGSIMAFSRDHEREADDTGLDLMVAAGYDPREAAKIWRALSEERKAADESEPFIFFATHPSTDERVQTLSRRASAVVGRQLVETGRERFQGIVAPHRAGWLNELVRSRKFAQTEVLLNRLLEHTGGRGELHFYQGELYRLRADDDDAAKAIAAYNDALRSERAPPETYRSLGLMQWRAGNEGSARTLFASYLDAAPEANDHEMIRSYLRELK